MPLTRLRTPCSGKMRGYRANTVCCLATAAGPHICVACGPHTHLVASCAHGSYVPPPLAQPPQSCTSWHWGAPGGSVVIAAAAHTYACAHWSAGDAFALLTLNWLCAMAQLLPVNLFTGKFRWCANGIPTAVAAAPQSGDTILPGDQHSRANSASQCSIAAPANSHHSPAMNASIAGEHIVLGVCICRLCSCGRSQWSGE